MKIEFKIANEQCRKLMDKHNLKNWNFKFNRAHKILGQANHNLREICLSTSFVKNNNWDIVQDVILHEIAHALLPSRTGHNSVWKRKCIEIGAIPERTMNLKGYIPSKGKYQFKCPGCGTVINLFRKTNMDKRACKSCCIAYNNGNYTKMFILEKIKK